MDHREVAAYKCKWYESLDERRMMATAIIYNIDEEGCEYEEEVEMPFIWEVCPTCRGRGRHVNPNIDSNGISPEEFEEDPSFREDYFNGIYDVCCYGCNGKRVIAVPDDHTEYGKLALEKMYLQAQWAAEDARAARMGY